MRARIGILAAVCLIGTCGRAAAATPASPWRLSWTHPVGPVLDGAFATLKFDIRPDASDTAAGPEPAATQGPPPVAIESSDAYYTRAKIHRLASFATLPLFGLQVVIGQKMFNNPATATSTNRRLHQWAGIGVVSLFGVNSVTGIWNMIEARHDPHGKTLRIIHGVLMLVADAGFAATVLTAPHHSASGLQIFTQKANQHLALAYASVSVGTVGYLVMLFGH